MIINEQDRRTVKTRQAIYEALFSLMQDKRYHKITIQDIIDRANIGRSTFYSHFPTKDELLLSSIENLLDELDQFMTSNIENGDDKPRLIPVAELFEHIKENTKVIKGLIKSDGAELFFAKAQTYWNIKIEEYLSSKLPKGKVPNVPITILTNHISYTLINLIKWWVNNKMSYSPLQMEQFFQELINPSIDSIIGNQLERG